MPTPRDTRFELGPAAIALFGALACACSSTKEWEERPGTLELYAEPLSPAAGEPLTLGVVGENVGPVDVFQGTTRVASFVNVDISMRYDVRVRAVSSELPRAVTTAYDRKTIEVRASSFPSAPAPVNPDAGATPADDSELCPGVEDLTNDACAPAVDAGSVAVRVHNATDGALSVYQLLPGVVEPSRCELSLVSLVGPKADGRFSLPAGAVLKVVDDRSARAVRIVRVPAIDVCVLRIPKD